MVYFNDQLKNTSYADKWRCELPTTSNLIRKFYKQGKYAIHNNLPHSSVNSVHGHSYVSLKDIIQDSLANDNKFEPIYNPPTTDAITCLNESSFCQDLDRKFSPNNDTIDLLLMRWSDDYDPYNVKQNKGNSIWVFLLQFIVNMKRSTQVITLTSFQWV